jgi:hypothetical protein
MKKPLYDLVRVHMKTERVRIVASGLTLAGALANAKVLDKKPEYDKHFHDAVPTGSYRNKQFYEGNRR